MVSFATAAIAAVGKPFRQNRAAIRFYEEISGNKGKVTFSGLLRLANAQDEAATTAMDRLAENLGPGMRMIAAALAPTKIIVVGEITSAWHTIGPKMELSLRQSSLAGSIRVRPAYDGASARLRGGVPLVLADHAFQTPLMGLARTEQMES